jgi:CDP-6-deoxy-D-xylo-4-hexulose-3-dehydrase
MINEIISQLSNISAPKYIKNYDNFDKTRDGVLYSGTFWDHNEIEAMLKAICQGDWIVSGSMVEKFQDEFSKKFNVKYSHMVNSGSSANLVMFLLLKKDLGGRTVMKS